ncbi:MAG: hypothetical protein LGR52_12580 [Candidatus Thiosymbion ectosymbiont of Robbea hypermnestra]|nr:hypothetical protein [Candidatus Thiosymbion ectosymbiont of Robbea hypermnestra]
MHAKTRNKNQEEKMQPIRIILDDAPENIHIPESLQHQRVEVIFWPLDTEDSIISSDKIKDLDSACGVLTASHSISLEQIEETIKKRECRGSAPQQLSSSVPRGIGRLSQAVRRAKKY